MQRNPTHPRRNRRHGAERDAAQPLAGQPRTGDEEDRLQEPEAARSRLTAREFQVPGPASESDGEESADTKRKTK